MRFEMATCESRNLWHIKLARDVLERRKLPDDGKRQLGVRPGLSYVVGGARDVVQPLVLPPTPGRTPPRKLKFFSSTLRRSKTVVRTRLSSDRLCARSDESRNYRDRASPLRLSSRAQRGSPLLARCSWAGGRRLIGCSVELEELAAAGAAQLVVRVALFIGVGAGSGGAGPTLFSWGVAASAAVMRSRFQLGVALALQSAATGSRVSGAGRPLVEQVRALIQGADTSTCSMRANRIKSAPASVWRARTCSYGCFLDDLDPIFARGLHIARAELITPAAVQEPCRQTSPQNRRLRLLRRDLPPPELAMTCERAHVHYLHAKCHENTYVTSKRASAVICASGRRAASSIRAAPRPRRARSRRRTSSPRARSTA